MHHGGPRFDVTPPPDGYAWWYLDGVSDDGEHALTIIAFIGSVFSPYYAWARRHAGAEPLNHCALNVALYSKGAQRWAMTERGRSRVRQDAESLQIGASAVRWTGSCVEITLCETCSPVPHRLRGLVRLFPSALCSVGHALDAQARHQWFPLAPCARVEVRLSSPQLRWQGSGYFDANAGSGPLENDFERWHWSRSVEAQRCLVLYDVTLKDGANRTLALALQPDGTSQPFEPPPAAGLPRTGWRMARITRADHASEPRVIETLEDAPFYSRSLLRTRLLGADTSAVHESLDLSRFKRAWVQCLLPFRMPRIA